MQYANGNGGYPFCSQFVMGCESLWITLSHSYSHQPVHESIHLPHSCNLIRIRIHIWTYRSTTVCLHAFPICAAFAYRIPHTSYRIPHIWSLSFALFRDFQYIGRSGSRCRLTGYNVGCCAPSFGNGYRLPVLVSVGDQSDDTRWQCWSV